MVGVYVCVLCLCLCLFVLFFFFFKQKTAYEVQYGLGGWEMCKRGGSGEATGRNKTRQAKEPATPAMGGGRDAQGHVRAGPLYTSEAADEEDSLELGGRRIFKKKNKTKQQTLTDRTTTPSRHH